MWKNSLKLMLVHCQGEIGKVIVGGAPGIPGATARPCGDDGEPAAGAHAA